MGSVESPRAKATVPTAAKDLLEAVKDGEAPESTDTNLRYAGYASKVKRLLLSAHRYVAYTSELAESMRPVAHPYLVTSGYAVSWLYLAGDVGYEGYKKYHHNQTIRAGLQESTATDKPASSSTAVSTTSTPTSSHIPAIEDYRAVMAQRAVFQSIASMGLPALMIHTIVKHSGRWLRHAKNVKIRTYGPVGVSLSSPLVTCVLIISAWSGHGPRITIHLRRAGRARRRNCLPQRLRVLWRAWSSRAQRHSGGSCTTQYPREEGALDLGCNTA